ncbi:MULTISPECIES: hypothetical protein [unclassified Fusibacter]|uniref:hypothetical protein n=1 Tax=unclassified Fusibacter TaxID=2624464 RepID=UPI00101206A8|nr:MULTISPECIES: hypothetical protein [unclassified Fusibacter]MCK8059006.1 hypothetical protein [Fusibacter sp. A2]NPE22417.1 hypothetical protein [Fusibacter sp. A1]RXV60523.1 hypothetical protein DWB64_11265 [Fusibacter sp. A1]
MLPITIVMLTRIISAIILAVVGIIFIKNFEKDLSKYEKVSRFMVRFSLISTAIHISAVFDNVIEAKELINILLILAASMSIYYILIRKVKQKIIKSK